MAKYIPLQALVASFWDVDSSAMPKEIQKRVQIEMFPWVWDRLSPGQRKQWVIQHDFLRDPLNQKMNEHYFNLASELGDLEREKRQLELMKITSPLELESQKRQLAAIAHRAEIINAELSPASIAGKTETPNERNKRLLRRRKELRGQGIHNPTKTLAEEFGISDSLVRRIVRESKPKPKKPGGILR